jgi:hypothetical protein
MSHSRGAADTFVLLDMPVGMVAPKSRMQVLQCVAAVLSRNAFFLFAVANFKKALCCLFLNAALHATQ